MQWDYMMVEEYLIEENYNRVFRDCVLHKHFLLQKKNQICVAAPEKCRFLCNMADMCELWCCKHQCIAMS